MLMLIKKGGAEETSKVTETIMATTGLTEIMSRGKMMAVMINVTISMSKNIRPKMIVMIPVHRILVMMMMVMMMMRRRRRRRMNGL